MDKFPYPAEDPLIRPFWEYASRGELRLPRLKDGSFDWYPTDPDAEWVPVSGRGTLFSWVEVHRPLHPGYAAMSPYVSAIVQLEDASDIRLVTRLVDLDGPPVAGMPVEVVFEDAAYPGGESGLRAPLFRPARDAVQAA